MSEQEMLQIYEQLEAWAVAKASHWAVRAGLERWLQDVQQEARVCLWTAITEYDGRRHNGEREGMIKQLCLQRLKHALRKYRRWDDHELQSLDILD